MMFTIALPPRFTSRLAQVVGVLSVSLVLSSALLSPMAEARLSDMLKRPPVLYLPSQLLPGKEAVFSIKAEVGKTVTLMISTQSAGFSLPDGRALNIGDPVVKEQMTVPENGVANFTIPLPEAIGDPGMKRYVEAIVSSDAEMTDAERAEIFSPAGPTADNWVEVGVLADGGQTMFLPSGSGEMSGLMRSMTAWGEVRGSERKQQLLDNGDINQSRQLDRNLNIGPSTSGVR